MQTQVEFRSDKFPPYDGEEDSTNPGVWGKRLAEYLVDRSAKHGIATDEPIAEDWGWYIPVRHPGLRVGLCWGHQGDEADAYLCFTEPAVPVKRKFFRTIDATVALTKLTDALRKILSDDADIRDVAWSEPG